MNPLRFSTRLMKDSERETLTDWGYIEALAFRRKEIRAGRHHDLDERRVTRYLREQLKRREKAVPMWLIAIAVRLIIKAIMERLNNAGNHG